METILDGPFAHLNQEKYTGDLVQGAVGRESSGQNLDLT
jgi:hypothetical protein